MKTGVPTVDALEEPLGLGDPHADAAVRGRVADRGGIGRAVDADAGAERPIQRVPSGLPGPGGTGLERPPPSPSRAGTTTGSAALITIEKRPIGVG